MSSPPAKIDWEKIIEDLNRSPESEYGPPTKCVDCKRVFITKSNSDAYCTNCGKNLYWQGPEFEKYSGPEYRKF